MKIVIETPKKVNRVVAFYFQQSVDLLGARYFAGIGEIALVEQPLSTERVGTPCKAQTSQTGFFSFPTSDEPASIEIYFEAVRKGVPFPFSISPVLIFRFIRILADPIVQHRNVVRGRTMPAAKEQKIATRFANVVERSICRNPWHRSWNWVLRQIASWHLAFGLADFRSGDFRKAMSGFDRAYCLNPGNRDALEWYWHARNRVEIDMAFK